MCCLFYKLLFKIDQKKAKGRVRSIETDIILLGFVFHMPPLNSHRKIANRKSNISITHGDVG